MSRKVEMKVMEAELLAGTFSLTSGRQKETQEWTSAMVNCPLRVSTLWGRSAVSPVWVRMCRLSGRIR